MPHGNIPLKQFLNFDEMGCDYPRRWARFFDSTGTGLTSAEAAKTRASNNVLTFWILMNPLRRAEPGGRRKLFGFIHHVFMSDKKFL